ncbi:MAG: RtcB family protein [Pyrinomonadaceae bacterium]
MAQLRLQTPEKPQSCHQSVIGISNKPDLSKRCRKDKGVIDEIPGADKDIEEVMHARSDLVEVVPQINQMMCGKG